jgi:MFS family permease
MMIHLLRNRSFFFLWLAQIATTLGNEFYNIGVIVAIYEQTGSAVQATGVLVARSVPSFLFSPLAGALVDRYDRRSVLVGMNLLRVFLIALFVLIPSGHAPNIWLIYAVVCGIAIADIVYRPAQMALIPSLVTQSLLVRANSLVMSTNMAAFALAYGLGGWLLAQLGGQTLILINLACFLLGALFAWQIGAPGAATATQAAAASLHRMIGDGVDYLRRHELARALVVMEAFEHIPHGIWTASIMLVFAEQALGATLEAWGYQMAVFWGSTVVGSILALLLAHRLGVRPGWVIVINAFINAGLTFVYALSPHLWVALFICALYGVPSAFRDVAQDTLLQNSVDQGMLGRVYAMRHMLVHLCFLCASLFFAALADYAPIRWVYLLGGALYLGTAFYALAQPSLRNARLAHLQRAVEAAGVS